MLAMDLVLTACSYADGESSKSNTPVGQANEGGVAMKGFVKDIEGLAVKNDEFRVVGQFGGMLERS